MKTIWNEVNVVSENLLNLYNNLIEFSEEIEYREGINHEVSAGDELKFFLAEMMDELQKLKPLDY